MPSAMTDDVLKFGACTFFARNHPGENCGSNGLPLTPSSITILSQAQRLIPIRHPNLCTYLEILRAKHERIIVVSEYAGVALCDVSRKLTHKSILKICQQMSSALQHLHSLGITHRNLSSDNILLDSNDNVKLFNYGLYQMTGEGKNVSFPIGHPKYLSPEAVQGGGGPSSDIWTLGMIILELCLGQLWGGSKPAPVLRRILSLIHTSNPAERIAREHDAIEVYKSIPSDLRNIIEQCLNISPSNRPDASQIIEKSLFGSFTEIIPKKRQFGLFDCPITFLYHWWQLAGGDIQMELKKQGFIKSRPPALSLPLGLLLDTAPAGCTLGGRSSAPALLERCSARVELQMIVCRLQHLPITDLYPLLTGAGAGEDLHRVTDSVCLPLIIRERDTEYQFHRMLLFQTLLKGYPYTAPLLMKEASSDIPPSLRGEVWAALLGVVGDYQERYERIDKETPSHTDRQIDVDIPRCHQYCWLLCGRAGHAALKRVLKSWLLTNPHYVYWQGLDSLTAPFLYLNSNNEARAFASLSAFVPKFLLNFFLKDNSAVIKEYLAKFWQITAFHDPELASHLHQINFVPELFAIPWFLTMFSHVFPLHKIVHLWDALLVEGGSLPLFLGVAILRQLRDTLLSSGFNECILLFSDLPQIDIEKCVTESIAMCRKSPQSISYRKHDQQEDESKLTDSIDIEASVLHTEISPRISCKDFVNLIKEDKCCVIDIRSNLMFGAWNVSGSVNVPHSGVQLGRGEAALCAAARLALAGAARRHLVVVVVCEREQTDAAQLVSKLQTHSTLHTVWRAAGARSAARQALAGAAWRHLVVVIVCGREQTDDVELYSFIKSHKKHNTRLLSRVYYQDWPFNYAYKPFLYAW